MTLEPLWHASWAAQVHVITLVLPLVIGTWQFFARRKAAAAHRRMGGVFVALMVVTALTTLWIHERAPRSPILGLSLLHLYVPLIMLLCLLAWYGATRRRRRLHRFALISLYFGSLMFTGLVQVYLTRGLPHQILFGR